MKNNLIITLLLLTFIFSSCIYPRYLPSSDKIDVNQYGSYIKINHKNGSVIKGELIAVDSNKIFVLVLTESYIDYTKKCVIIPINEIQRFKLQYAKPKKYGWTIPLYTLATISHGYWAIYSLPINLIVTVSVVASGDKAFKYSDKEISYKDLKKYARFPQGIPPKINIVSIE